MKTAENSSQIRQILQSDYRVKELCGRALWRFTGLSLVGLITRNNNRQKLRFEMNRIKKIMRSEEDNANTMDSYSTPVRLLFALEISDIPKFIAAYTQTQNMFWINEYS